MARTLSPADLPGLIPPGALRALGPAVRSATELRGGRHVNLCLRIETDEGARVLRVRRAGIEQPGADFGRELACHRAAAQAGLAPRVHAASVEEGWLLMEYVPQPPWTIAQLETPSGLARLCARLHALHALAPPPLPAFDASALLAEQVRAFLAGGRKPLPALDEASAVAGQLAGLPRRPQVICHGDPDVGNLLGEGPMLIDFEYSQLADPTYDLAALVAYYPWLEPRAEALLAAAGLDEPLSRRRFPLQLRLARLVNQSWAALQPAPLD